MTKKRILTMILAVLMLGVFAGVAQAASPAVVLDGQQLAFDVAPTIDNGRTLVPLRTIFESLGADVTWDGETSTVTALKDDTTIRLQIGNANAYRNGNPVELDVSGKIVQGRTMVPLRFVGEALNCQVEWNGPGNRVEILSAGQETVTPAIAQQTGYMKDILLM